MWERARPLGYVPMCFMFCAVLAACGKTGFVPPSSELRTQLGTVAVVSVAAKSSMEDPNLPGTSDAVAKGAGKGAGATVVAGGELFGKCVVGSGGLLLFGCPLFLVAGIVLAPVGAVVGGVVGAVKAPATKSIEKATENIRKAWTGLSPNADLRKRVVAAMGDLTKLDVIDLSEAGKPKSFALLAKEGVDTVLDLTVTEFALKTDNSFNPNSTLEIRAQARLIRAADSEELYRRVWKYLGTTWNYRKLAMAEPKHLREEVFSAYEMIAEKLVLDLFATTASEIPLKKPLANTVYTVEGPKN